MGFIHISNVKKEADLMTQPQQENFVTTLLEKHALFQGIIKVP